MKKVAVILSGCGFKDGSEITESVSTFIALDQLGAKAICFAPSIEFSSTPHFAAGQSDSRNTLVESARLCRGNILPLNQLNEIDFDALIFPGGFGAAKHLSNWATQLHKCQIHPEVESIIRAFHKASKPIGAICIAPTLVAKALSKYSVTLTVGNDAAAIAEIEKMGAIHEECPVDDYVSDRENKVVTTPAYMYDEATPAQVFKGVSGLVKEIFEMA